MLQPATMVEAFIVYFKICIEYLYYVNNL